MTSRRALTSGLLVGGVVLAGSSPAGAQGNPVGGAGNSWFLAGAGNTSGAASQTFVYGDRGDDVYVGDFVDAAGVFGGDAIDDVMVRRGNSFIIRGQAGRVFRYGDPGDTVLVGDWDGDGTDTLAVRRGNRYFVKDDVNTGKADYDFYYGDPGDQVFVGNWDGDSSAADDPDLLLTDTLMIRRGVTFYVKNDTESGTADYTVRYGNAWDTFMVGDWALPPLYGDDPATSAKETSHVIEPGESGDYADQLAVRRGNQYFLSEELWQFEMTSSNPVPTEYSLAYGNPTDTSFTAQLAWSYDLDGEPDTLYGDGLAVRR